MSTQITMIPQQCKILISQEVEKQFESSRELVEEVMKTLQTHMMSLKSQAKERAEAERNLRQLGGEGEDIKEMLLSLASLQREFSTETREITKKLDVPVRNLNRWLNDPSTKQDESCILEQADKLKDHYTQMMGKISKLHKAYSKKLRLIERVKQQIDGYPMNGLDDRNITELKIKLEHFEAEAQAVGQRYRHALDTELRNRPDFLRDVEDLQCLFVKHEEKRLLTVADCIGKYSSILTKYNNPRSPRTLDPRKEAITLGKMT